MRLFILGANGKVGTQLIDLALSRTHQVTAFVRSPEKITQQHPRLQVVRGDPHNVDELARSLPGHDAVLSALGVRPPLAFRPHTLVQECAASHSRCDDPGRCEAPRPGLGRSALPRGWALFRLLSLASFAHRS